MSHPKCSVRTVWMAAAAMLLCVIGATAAPTPDTIPAQGSAIHIMPVFHASVEIEYAGKVIAVDPVSAGTYPKRADMVLITHAHPDHLDKSCIQRIATPSVHVLAPRAIAQQLTPVIKKPGVVMALPNGGAFDFNTTGASGKKVTIHIQAVAMYNLVRGPKPGQKFHPRGDGNGYVLTLGGKHIYVAGDTEVTPAMRGLKHIDVAFLPMNLPYTMTPQEAAAGASAFKPKVVYPYHYRYPFNKPNTNPQQFAAALKGTGIDVRIREWYPADAVARAKG